MFLAITVDLNLVFKGISKIKFFIINRRLLKFGSRLKVDKNILSHIRSFIYSTFSIQSKKMDISWVNQGVYFVLNIRRIELVDSSFLKKEDLLF